jgi:hypothetical protein
MAESIRCPHCGKAYVLKPELAGKQVRCRQCQKAFTVTAPKPPDDAEEPIVLSLATPEPPAPTAAYPNLDQLLTSGPALAPPGQEETLAVGTVLPLGGQTVLGPVVGRRRSPTSTPWWRQWLERLLDRKLTAAVAIASLGLFFVFVLLFFAAGLSWFFIVPPFAGAGLVLLGVLLPVPKRPKRPGPWLGPSGTRIAVGSGVFGLVFLVVYAILVAAAQTGHSIPKAIGLSNDNTIILIVGLFGCIGGCFAACILTLLLSGGWAVARQYGLLRIGNFLYLVASPLILLILCVCGLASGLGRGRPPVAYQPPTPQINRDGSMTPAWRPDPNWPNPNPNPTPMRSPQASPMGPQMPMPRLGPQMGPRMGPGMLPPGAFDANDPEFYRKMLAELRSTDVNHRRVAVAVLSHVEPKELREEITKAIEPLVNDSDDIVRSQSLAALDVWSSDVVPIAIRALDDSSDFVRNSALEILERRKDSRAIEPMIALLSDPMNMRVAKCLEQMGSQVEDAVLARYDSGNDHARRFIIQILGAVATEKGLAKLRKIAADKSDRSSAVYARFMLQRRGERVTD